MQVYQQAILTGDLTWRDVSKLVQDKRTLGLADQLYRAVGSVSANIAEGYSRRSGKDQARFYEYALGSAREARGWYYQARHLLPEAVATHRIGLLTQIIRLLLTIIPAERGFKMAEEKRLTTHTPLPCSMTFHSPDTQHATRNTQHATRNTGEQPCTLQLPWPCAT